MSNEFYNDLSTSLNQALAIAKGEAEPSRQFSHEVPDIESIRAETGLSQQLIAKISLSNNEKLINNEKKAL